MGLPAFDGLISSLYPHKYSLVKDGSRLSQDHSRWSEVYSWCKNTFGQAGGSWVAFADRGGYIFRFANESDLTWFILKWG
jgi:hypothetical protein